MTGWGKAGSIKFENKTDAITPTAAQPTPATLSEVATAAQRWQLSTLVDALKAHPDLAAQVYLALRATP